MECSLLACPSLLHLLGRLLLDLFVVVVSVDSEFFLCGSRVIFLVCAYFCYSPVIAFLVGGYETYMTGLLPFLDVDEASVPLIYWNRVVLSG